VVGGNMTQQLEMPVNSIQSVVFSPIRSAWIVSINEPETESGVVISGVELVCSLIASNVDIFYVSCDEVIGGDLPDYVKPMERDE